jgi:tripartite ATP-independent transporter DctM subunit
MRHRTTPPDKPRQMADVSASATLPPADSAAAAGSTTVAGSDIEATSPVGAETDFKAAAAPKTFKGAVLAASESATPAPPARRTYRWAERLVEGLVLAFSVLTMVTLAGMLVLVLLEVLGRDVFNFDLVWDEEAVTLGVFVIAFLGSAVAYMRREHFALVAIRQRFSPRMQVVADAANEWIVAVVCGLVAYVAMPLVPSNWRIELPDLPISQSWSLIPIPVGMLMIVVIALLRISAMPWRVTVPTGVVIGAITLAIFLCRNDLASVLTPSSALLAALPFGIIALVIGVPVIVAFFLIGLIFVPIVPGLQLVTLPLSMQQAISNFVLVALPFFFVLAYLLVEAGLGSKLGDLTEVTLGRVRHGPMYSILVTMFVFSGLSGSKNADIAAVGGPMLEISERRGYSRREGAALLAASAAMGETIPPSIALLILASLTTLSVGSLFIAGILPAVVLAILLAVAVTRLPTPDNPKAAGERRSIGRLTLANIPILGGLLFLVGSIVKGIATPTEASALVVFYILIVALVIYRSLSARGIVRALATAGSRGGAILLVVAAGGALTRVLALSNTPTEMANALLSAGQHGAWIFMILSTLLLIVVGCLLEGLPAMLIFVPILAPVAIQLGINPLQYGIIIILAMGIGTHTPPLGVGLYTASMVGNVSVESVGRSMWKYLAFLYLGLLIVIFVPGITTWLPNALGIN